MYILGISAFIMIAPPVFSRMGDYSGWAGGAFHGKKV
jgi:hypothetical protein